MQLNAQVHAVEVSDDRQTTQATIKADAMMFEILSTRLYSDPILAVVREYLCNALDIHREFKITKPFYMSLPNQQGGEPMMVLRDFGPGLRRDQMHYVTEFGSSSKRADNESVGGLGIGMKTGLAYSDSFVITVFQLGEKRSYVYFKGPDGIPVLTNPEVSPTDERDGLEIRVPIKRSDYDSFIDRAQRVLKHFPAGSYQTFGFDAPSERWASQELTYGTLHTVPRLHRVLMGPVSYVLDWSQVPGEAELPKAIVPIFEIGELAMSPNRETLLYSPDTIAALKKRRDEIVETISSSLRVEYDACRDVVERQEMLQRLQQTGLYGMFRSAYSDVSDTVPLTAQVLDNKRLSTKRDPLGLVVNTLRSAAFVWDDIPATDSKKRLVARIRNRTPRKVYVVSPYKTMAGSTTAPVVVDSMKTFEELQARLFGLTTVWKLSDLVAPAPIRSPQIKREKRPVRVMRWVADPPYSRGWTRTHFKDQGDEVSEGIYVPIVGTELQDETDRAYLKSMWAAQQPIYGLSKAARAQTSLENFNAVKPALQALHAAAIADPDVLALMKRQATVAALRTDDKLRGMLSVLQMRSDCFAAFNPRLRSIADLVKSDMDLGLVQRVACVRDFAAKSLGKLPKVKADPQAAKVIKAAFARSAFLRLLLAEPYNAKSLVNAQHDDLIMEIF